MIFPKSDIRSQIVSILSEDFPLSFRKISNKLRKNFSKTISDKALYRTIALMIDEEILIKENGEYLINAKWLDNLEKFKEKVVKKYIEGNLAQKDKQKIYALAKQQCSCGKGFAEGFCFVCNEPVCSECGEKTRMHYSCSKKCEHCKEEPVGKCANCLKDVCISCSKEVWAHFSENCIKKPEKVVLGILEVDHECWFADLSEKTETPIVLNSFMDDRDEILGTHSGRVVVSAENKQAIISQLLKHRQVVEVKPLFMDKQIILRTRALFNKSVDEFVRKNKSILLNPIEANDTKERNLIISPSHKEINTLVKGLNEFGNCKLVASEEIEMQKINSPISKEIKTFVNLVNKEDLDSAVQKMRLIKKFYE